MSLTELDLHRAVRGRLTDRLVGQVFDAEPSQAELVGVDEYVILLTGVGPVIYDRMSTTRTRVQQPFSIMCGGRTVDDVLDCVRQVRDALQGWDAAPDDPGVTLLVEDPVNVPILPYRSVEGDTRYTITPTYRLAHDH